MIRRYAAFALALTVALVLGASGARAADSDEKPLKDQLSGHRKKATEKYNKGVEHMDKAREKATGNDSTYAFNYRATTDAKVRREYEKAIDDLQDATDYDPTMKEAYNNLGYCYRKIGKLEESLEAYNRALSFDGNFEQAREYRGELFLAMGELKKAQEELTFLQERESAYADTLAQAIEVYRLQQFNDQVKKASESSEN